MGADPARAVPYLAVVMECDRPVAGGARYSLEAVDCVRLGRGAERGASRSRQHDLTMLDVVVPAPSMSTAHARLVRAGDGWLVEDCGSTNGTFLNGTRITRAPVGDGDIVTTGRTLLMFAGSRMTPLGAPTDLDTSGSADLAAHVTLDPELRAQLDALARVSASELAILIRGETGTGKEVLAREVHERSGRAGPFVAINCGAIPAGLVESHLFGHVKGAFSGALRDEPGLFRAAHGGTLFLDEIGDLPAVSQAALLRVLQEREVLPVGATRPVRVEIGVVSATHQPLESMVERGTFRRDLLGRLAGFTVQLPPLRARRIDLGVLVASLLRRLVPARAEAVRFTASAAEALLRHDWPLNTRELEQSLGRALALAGSAAIDVEHLPPAVVAPREPASDAPAIAPGALSPRDTQLRAELLEQLARHRGNLAEVARAMGKARMQVHRWCKRFGVDPDVYRD